MKIVRTTNCNSKCLLSGLLIVKTSLICVLTTIFFISGNVILNKFTIIKWLKRVILTELGAVNFSAAHTMQCYNIADVDKN